MRIFFETFSTGQTVMASGVSNATLQSWLKRDVVIGMGKQPVSGAGSPGIHRRFTFRNVMEIALAKVILDTCSVSVNQAFHAAGMYAHTGDFTPIARVPGLPYKGRILTLACIAGDRCTVFAYHVGRDPYPTIAHTLGNPDGVGLIPVNPVFDRVSMALGYDPRDVLTEAYYSKDAGK